MRKLFRSALFLCCLYSFVHSLPAQSPFSLAGTVHDASGGRIPRAHITVRLEGASPAVEVETAEDGSFLAPLAALGSYSVQVAAEGFEPLEGPERQAAMAATAAEPHIFPIPVT